MRVYDILSPMDADFFLTSITPDFAGVCDSSLPCFLNPGAHFVFILIEPIATKYLAPGESLRCSLYESLANFWIVGSFSMPPRCFQRIVWIMNPLWARNSIAFAQKLDSGGTKRAPAVSMLCVWYRSGERLTH